MDSKTWYSFKSWWKRERGMGWGGALDCNCGGVYVYEQRFLSSLSSLFSFFFFEIRSQCIALAGQEILQTRLALNSGNKPVSQVARLKVCPTTPRLVSRGLVFFRAPAGQCRAELCHWWVQDDTIRVKNEIVALSF